MYPKIPLEELANEYFDIDTTADLLTQEERRKISDISDWIFSQAFEIVGTAQYNNIGLRCATDRVRNYLLGLMTANAVRYAKQISGREVLMAELGMGAGITVQSALAVEPDTRILAYEQDAYTIEFAESLLRSKGLLDKVKIIQGDFLKETFPTNIDVVVNENIGPDLISEPQFQASARIIPYTHEKTLFVPGGADVYLVAENNRSRKNGILLGRVDFSRAYRSPIKLEAQIPERMLDDFGKYFPYCFMLSDLLDCNGRRFLTEKGENGIETLRLMKIIYHKFERYSFVRSPKSDYCLRLYISLEGDDPGIVYSAAAYLKKGL